MRSNFLQNYEKNLVESAVRSAMEDIAVALRDDGVSLDVILRATGVDVDNL